MSDQTKPMSVESTPVETADHEVPDITVPQLSLRELLNNPGEAQNFLFGDGTRESANGTQNEEHRSERLTRAISYTNMLIAFAKNPQFVREFQSAQEQATVGDTLETVRALLVTHKIPTLEQSKIILPSALRYGGVDARSSAPTQRLLGKRLLKLPQLGVTLDNLPSRALDLLELILGTYSDDIDVETLWRYAQTSRTFIQTAGTGSVPSMAQLVGGSEALVPASMTSLDQTIEQQADKMWHYVEWYVNKPQEKTNGPYFVEDLAKDVGMSVKEVKDTVSGYKNATTIEGPIDRKLAEPFAKIVVSFGDNYVERSETRRETLRGRTSGFNRGQKLGIRPFRSMVYSLLMTIEVRSPGVLETLKVNPAFCLKSPSRSNSSGSSRKRSGGESSESSSESSKRSRHDGGSLQVPDPSRPSSGRSSPLSRSSSGRSLSIESGVSVPASGDEGTQRVGRP
ncbi:hypothetical protein M231_05098 [Tremella mesenterica]|uniref:Uncharacterized protein n=1 Tax=Tremella mesenterica TaxID=5217 RepID=A0A4Q1BJ48_TREME|nr:hypothetical protein M231_05098 [Tremella mesenterica]